MQFEELHTPRLILRKFIPETYDYIHAKMDDIEIMAILGLQTPEELLKEKDKYGSGLSTYNRSFTTFQVIDRETKKIIGGCGYHTWYPDHKRAEIGYGLNDDSYKQRGIMTEALLPILKYGFEKMEALIGPENIASQKLIMNFNFTKEGVLREHYVVNSISQDSVAFSLLKYEFRF